jgi:uncharacterized protein (TIGR02598 family)
MFRSPCNNRGFTLVEVVIAFGITAVAVMAIFALMAPGWRTTTRSDLTGRAANILYDQLQQQEVRIMNPCNAVVAGTTAGVAVYASGGATPQASGDARYEITTTITLVDTNVWRVDVSVDWPGHTRVSDSLVVTRQNDYRFPEACVMI